MSGRTVLQCSALYDRPITMTMELVLDIVGMRRDHHYHYTHTSDCTGGIVDFLVIVHRTFCLVRFLSKRAGRHAFVQCIMMDV